MIDVSIIVPYYNLEASIQRAVLSALSQENLELEVIVIDDASTDASAKRLNEINDVRLKVIRHNQNSGAGEARNSGIDAAQGQWIAVLDGDDYMEAGRVSTLIAQAQSYQADIACDNLRISDQYGNRHGLFFEEKELIVGNFLKVEDFLKCGNLGYLKPLFRTDFIKKHSIKYDKNLRIGEDYHFILDALLYGAVCVIGSPGGYHYTRHQNSTSHRITSKDLENLIHKTTSLQKFHKNTKNLEPFWKKRIKTLSNRLAYEMMVETLKQKDVLKFFKFLILHPKSAIYFHEPAVKRLFKIFKTKSQGQ